MIIGLHGVAGSGKSTAARILCQHEKFVEIAIADPMKRMLMDVMGWDEYRLWGNSRLRDEPDPLGRCTIRKGCQKIGQGGREAYEDIWIDKAITDAMAVLASEKGNNTNVSYSRTKGTFRHWKDPHKGVVISDVRHDNEAKVLRMAGGKIVRLVRDDAGIGGEAGEHISEKGIDPALVDFVVDNNLPLDHLERSILAIVRKLRG
jgi:hypothetical protein